MSATLHQAHALLMKANHDYDGHRAKAAQHITHGIREFNGNQSGSNGSATSSGTRGTTNTGSSTSPHHTSGNGSGFALQQTQAQSDAHLQQALKMLTGTTGQLSNSQAASQQVQAAISELNAALKIR